jgi:hypothetical protein
MTARNNNLAPDLKVNKDKTVVRRPAKPKRFRPLRDPDGWVTTVTPPDPLGYTVDGTARA